MQNHNELYSPISQKMIYLFNDDQPEIYTSCFTETVTCKSNHKISLFFYHWKRGTFCLYIGHVAWYETISQTGTRVFGKQIFMKIRVKI